MEGIAPVGPIEEIPSALTDLRITPLGVFPWILNKPFKVEGIAYVAFVFAEVTAFRIALAFPDLEEELVGRFDIG